MGLLDFLFGTKSSTAKKKVGDHTITSTVTVRKAHVVKNDAPDRDIPRIKDTLRELKVYSERVAHPCGFDFSAVRRHKGQSGEWWLDGANFERACEALVSLLPFEEQARAEVPGFPNVIERLIDHSVPYSPGADGNLVPYISRGTTKKRGTVISAHFMVSLTEFGMTDSATVYFADDGKVTEARVSRHDGGNAGSWHFRVDTPKRTGVLTYKGCVHEESR